jgi:hypothetical protein
LDIDIDNAFGTRPQDAVFLSLTRLTNRHAFRISGKRNTCIWSAGALRDVLRVLGYSDADCLRVEAVATPRGGDPHYCRSLGTFGSGRRRPASVGWAGHLAVVVDRTSEDIVLLDPTLDQLRHGSRFYSYLKPFAARVSASALTGLPIWLMIDAHGVGAETRIADHDVRYKIYPGLGGWRSKPAFGLRWRQKLADAVLRSHFSTHQSTKVA